MVGMAFGPRDAALYWPVLINSDSTLFWFEAQINRLIGRPICWNTPVNKTPQWFATTLRDACINCAVLSHRKKCRNCMWRIWRWHFMWNASVAFHMKCQHQILHTFSAYYQHRSTSIRPDSWAHSGAPAHGVLHCQVALSSGRSLGRDWGRRPGRSRARWTDQLRNDAGLVPANLWRQAVLRGHSGVTQRPELATRWRRQRRRRLGWQKSTITGEIKFRH